MLVPASRARWGRVRLLQAELLSRLFICFGPYDDDETYDECGTNQALSPLIDLWCGPLVGGIGGGRSGGGKKSGVASAIRNSSALFSDADSDCNANPSCATRTDAS